MAVPSRCPKKIKYNFSILFDLSKEENPFFSYKKNDDVNLDLESALTRNERFVHRQIPIAAGDNWEEGIYHVLLFIKVEVAVPLMRIDEEVKKLNIRFQCGEDYATLVDKVGPKLLNGIELGPAMVYERKKRAKGRDIVETTFSEDVTDDDSIDARYIDVQSTSKTVTHDISNPSIFTIIANSKSCNPEINSPINTLANNILGNATKCNSLVEKLTDNALSTHNSLERSVANSSPDLNMGNAACSTPIQNMSNAECSTPIPPMSNVAYNTPSSASNSIIINELKELKTLVNENTRKLNLVLDIITSNAKSLPKVDLPIKNYNDFSKFQDESFCETIDTYLNITLCRNNMKRRALGILEEIVDKDLISALVYPSKR